MKIYGRKILDSDKRISLDAIDAVVFELGKGRKISVSLYGAREKGEIEIVAEDIGMLSVHPRAANVIKVSTERIK